MSGPKRNDYTDVESPDRGAAYTPEQFEFLKAIDRYKREKRRPHPTWLEVLAVAKSLGYRKTQQRIKLPTFTGDA